MKLFIKKKLKVLKKSSGSSHDEGSESKEGNGPEGFGTFSCAPKYLVPYVTSRPGDGNERNCAVFCDV